MTGRAGEWRLAPTSALLAQAPDMALSSNVIPAALLYYALFFLFFSRQLKNLFTNMRRGVPTAVYMAMMVCTLWVAFAPVCSPCFSPFGGYGPGLLPFVSHSLPRSLFFGGVGPGLLPSVSHSLLSLALFSLFFSYSPSLALALALVLSLALFNVRAFLNFIISHPLSK